MDSYDLITEPWITCAMRNGDRQTFGLHDVLEQAHNIVDIAEQSPLTTFGIYRLLIAIVHWLSPITSIEQWQERWQAGRFPPQLTSNLIERGKNSFDLFHPERPFYQEARIAADAKSISYLVPETPTATSLNHFHHSYDKQQQLCPACCAKGLIHLPPFCTAGGAGLSPSINGVPVYYVLPVGAELFSTLMLNLPVPTVYPQHITTCPTSDHPLWDNNQSASQSIGFLEGLTWQPRRTRLLKNAKSEGGTCTNCGRHAKPLIRSMIFAKGRSPKESANRPWSDPNIPLKNERPLQPSVRSDFWRIQLRALLAINGDGTFHAPPIWRQAQALAFRGLLGDRSLGSHHFMFRAKQAAPTWHAQQSINIPIQFLRKQSLVTCALNTLNVIEKTSNLLYKRGSLALRQFESDAHDMFIHDVLVSGSNSLALADNLSELQAKLKLIASRYAIASQTDRPVSNRWKTSSAQNIFTKKLSKILVKGGEKG